jgi:virulence factor Mce-like protein
VRPKHKRGLSNVAAGVLVLVLVSIGVFFGFTKHNPFADHYKVKAIFPTANNVRPSSPVRIAGVNVGKVTRVRHVGGGAQATEVEMDLTKGGLPIHRDAQMTVRPRIFLEGNFFVDVRPGSPSAPLLREGDTIPINQTRSPVQIDQVLGTLQAPTRRDLQGLLHELSRGLGGAGARGYRNSLPSWEPAYRDSAIVNDATLGLLRHDLSSYLRGAGRTAAALDRSPQQLQALLTEFHTTAHAFAVKDKQLGAAIAELPRTLGAARPALAALNRSFPSVRRLVRAFRPAVRSSGPAIDASLPLVRELRGLVRRSELRGLVSDLRPTVPALAALSRASLPLYGQVSQASNCQNDVILPWTKQKIQDATFPTDLPIYQESTRFLPGIAAESRSGDANGQWFRVLVNGGLYAYPGSNGSFFLTGEPLQGTNPRPAPRPPLKPDVPCETQQPADVRSIPGPAPEGFKVQAPGGELTDRARSLAESRAVKWLKGQIKDDGLAGKLRVSTKDVTEATLRAAGKAAGK